MMRLWLESYTKSSPISASAVVSIVAHAALITAAVAATKGPDGVPPGSIANRVYYLPPPDRAPGQPGSQETLQYVDLAPVGPGAGFGANHIEEPQAPTPLPSADTGDMGLELTTTPPAPALPGADSVFAVLDVDTAAARYPGSAAPAYPLTMLRQGVQGSVATQYVVDTNGVADTASLKILRATHPDFVDAVRAALPYMRFMPAKIGAKPVRQLVEQEFSFKIEQAGAIPDSGKKPVP